MKTVLVFDHLTSCVLILFDVCLTSVSPPLCPFSFPISFLLINLIFQPSILCVDSLHLPSWAHPHLSLFSLVVASDLKDFQNNKNRYLIASENQRPGHFSTAPIGSLTASPSSGALCNQGGLQSVTSIQERIMSTPGGEEAIERLKVKMTRGAFKVHKCSHSSHERRINTTLNSGRRGHFNP